MAIAEKKYSMNIEEAFQKALEAIKNNGWTLRDFKQNEKILAETDVSLRSWGEEIEIKLLRRRDNVEVIVSSEPIHQIIDWGKSTDNVKDFFQKFEKGN